MSLLPDGKNKNSQPVLASTVSNHVGVRFPGGWQLLINLVTKVWKIIQMIKN